MSGCAMHESITYGCSACHKMERAADALEARLSAIQQMVNSHAREIAEWKRRAYRAEDELDAADLDIEAKQLGLSNSYGGELRVNGHVVWTFGNAKEARLAKKNLEDALGLQDARDTEAKMQEAKMQSNDNRALGRKKSKKSGGLLQKERGQGVPFADALQAARDVLKK